MDKTTYVARIRLSPISWWAEVWRGDDRVYQTACFTEWGARFSARRHARRIARLDARGILNGSWRA